MSSSLNSLNPDVNECQNDVLNECDHNALCTNTEGFYICRCLRGYQGDGRFCTGKVITACASLHTTQFIHTLYRVIYVERGTPKKIHSFKLFLLCTFYASSNHASSLG